MRFRWLLALVFSRLHARSTPEPVTDLPALYSSAPNTPVPQHLDDPISFNSSATTLPLDDDEDPCRPRTLSPKLWSDLNLNQYLLNYPGGREISLEVQWNQALQPKKNVF